MNSMYNLHLAWVWGDSINNTTFYQNQNKNNSWEISIFHSGIWIDDINMDFERFNTKTDIHLPPGCVWT